MTHVLIPAVAEARQRVMRSAHFRARQGRIPFAEALRQAWAIEKGLTEEGARPRQVALSEAVTPPPAATLPPLRRSRPTRTASHARRERRVPEAPRRNLTVQLGHAFARTLQMVDAWVSAGRPVLSPNELAAVGVIAEAAIDLLDAAQPDPDLEPNIGAGEPLSYGPTLRSWDGVIRTMCDQTDWATGNTDDRECDPAEGPEGGDEREPSLGSIETVGNPSYRTPYPRAERTICFRGDQTRWSAGSADDLEEGDDNGIADCDGAWDQYGAELGPFNFDLTAN